MKKFNIAEKVKEFQSLQRTLPKVLGNIAVRHFLKAFDDEAFSDASERSDPWAARTTATKRDRVTGLRRALLVQQGSLKGSIRVKSATWKRIEVGSYGVKYARYHNRGEGNLPRRQFIGKSAILRQAIKNRISNEINKAFR
jgi:phage gpG-like protein